LSRNKFEFEACDWLSQSAATLQKKKTKTKTKQKNMADGKDEPEFEVDQ